MNYVIHSEWVRSKNDGQEHFISFSPLVRLYGLDPKDCVEWNYDNPRTWLGRKELDYIHLYPKYNGNYRNIKKVGHQNEKETKS